MAGVYFKDVVDQVMIASGVVKQSSGKSHNPNRRLMVEQNALGQYMEKMTNLWLKARAFHDVEPLAEWTEELANRALLIQNAARNTLQLAQPGILVLRGAISVADVMLAGFSHTTKSFAEFVEAAHEESKEDPRADLEWGPSVDELYQWATHIGEAPPPKRPKKTDVKVDGPGGGAGAAAGVEATTSTTEPTAETSGKEAGNDGPSPQSGRQTPTEYFAVARDLPRRGHPSERRRAAREML